MTLVALLALISPVFAEAPAARRNLLGHPRPQRQQTVRTAQTDQPSSGSSVPAGGRAIEFADDTPVAMYLTVYGELVNKTVLVDPQVPKTSFGLHPQKDQKLTEEDKIEAIETVLEMNGVHLEPFGEKFVRALPRKNVRKEGIPLYLDEKALEADVETGKVTEGKVISFMIRFKYISAEDMEKVALKVLESFKSDQSGAPVVLSTGRRVLVTDTYLNVKRMLEIVTEIDVEQPAEPLPEVECIQIQNASASDIVPIIEKIVTDSLKEQEEQQKKGVATSGNSAPVVPNRPLLGGFRRPGQPAQQEAPAAALVVNASEAAHGIIKGRVTVIAEPKSNKIILITKAENMQMFKKIIEALDVKTTLDTTVKVYRLKYADAEDVSDMFNDLIGNSASGRDSKANQNMNAKSGSNANLTRNTQAATRQSANQKTGEPSAGELNKENTVVLADKRINGLVVMSTKELFPTIEQIIERMDIKLSQVLIETAIIEVTLGDDLQTGVDWLQKGRHKTEDGLEKGDLWNGNDGYAHMFGGGGGTSAGLLNTLVSVGSNVVAEAANLSPAGSGLNYFLKSDKLNLAAVIKASQSDSHAKYIASPVVMTVDNKEATIEATEARKFFNGYETSSGGYNYVRTPKYDSKDIGITIKVTPKINPNGTVMLEVEEEYSQLGAGQAILVDDGGTANIDTSLTRKMAADILLDNMQTVVLGGLTETYTSEKETGIPILKDIPIVGKWLFGSVSQTESRKELLVFMTPYVLDDSTAAQTEALRRKKALSDPTPWDDHGWSASNLADPVSKQEQMRRIKAEWRKQDEERRTKIAIEKEKVERAQKLQELSAEEREIWLKMHKAELEEEAREELEEKMLDEKSQEELKKLAAEVRAKKLGEAEKAIKAAENERGKLEAEKKAEKGERGTGKREEKPGMVEEKK